MVSQSNQRKDESGITIGETNEKCMMKLVKRTIKYENHGDEMEMEMDVIHKNKTYL